MIETNLPEKSLLANNSLDTSDLTHFLNLRNKYISVPRHSGRDPGAENQ